MIPYARIHRSIWFILISISISISIGIGCSALGAQTNILAVQNAPLESHYWPRHTSPHASARERWGALVVSEENYATSGGMNGTTRRANVTVGVTLNAETPFHAELAALSECEKSGAEKCRIVVYFTRCGFITNGEHRVRKEQYKYAHGSSSAETLYECEKDGYRCNAPIGGCNRE